MHKWMAKKTTLKLLCGIVMKSYGCCDIRTSTLYWMRQRIKSVHLYKQREQALIHILALILCLFHAPSSVKTSPAWFRLGSAQSYHRTSYTSTWLPEPAVTDISQRPVMSWRQLNDREQLPKNIHINTSKPATTINKESLACFWASSAIPLHPQTATLASTQIQAHSLTIFQINLR